MTHWLAGRTNARTNAAGSLRAAGLARPADRAAGWPGRQGRHPHCQGWATGALMGPGSSPSNRHTFSSSALSRLLPERTGGIGSVGGRSIQSPLRVLRGDAAHLRLVSTRNWLNASGVNPLDWRLVSEIAGLYRVWFAS